MPRLSRERNCTRPDAGVLLKSRAREIMISPMKDRTATASASEAAVYVRPDALLRHARERLGRTGCAACGSGQSSLPEIADFLGIPYVTLWRLLGNPYGTSRNPGRPRERRKASDAMVRTITDALPHVDADELFERVDAEPLGRTA
jgi:hypothetical protein